MNPGVAEYRTDFVRTTSLNVGAASNGAVAQEGGDQGFHSTVLNLVDVPITVRDTEQGGGIKIYDFPAGVLYIIAAVAQDLQVKTTSDPTGTLNAGAGLGRIGVGTVTQTSATLTTTEQNIVPVTTFTPAAQNVKSAAVGNHLAAPALFDGHTTPIDLFLNISVPGATDIDANATVLVTGKVIVTWVFAGDYT